MDIQTIWIRYGEDPNDVSNPPVTSVFALDLIKRVKDELPKKYQEVPLNKMKLYTTKGGEFIPHKTLVSKLISGRNLAVDELFLEVPEPVAPPATVSERESKRLKFNDSPEESKEVAITKKGYDAEYVGRDLVVLPTLNVLNTYVKQWKAGGYHSPYTAVVGPSMVGKTRLILELAKEVCVVYICLRPLDSTGQPPRSLLANTILEPNVGNREEWYTSLIASILSVVAERFQTNKNLADWRSFNDSENFATSVTDRLKGALTGNHEKDLVAAEAGAKKALECIIKTPLKILLAFDEARSLLAVVEHGVCAFRAMRRALRKLPTSSCVYALFTDTTSKIANFTPPLKLDPSARPTSGLDSGKLFPPIYRIASFDAMVDNTDCCFNDLHSVARLLRYGVPFYHLYFEEAKQEGAADVNVAKHLVEFALMKLTFAKNSELEPVNLNVQQAFALLGATIKPYISASSSLSSELVSSHVAHCLHINPAREVILSAYPSQPIYAAAANQYLHKNPYSLVRCIKLLTMALRDGIVSRGDAGELASRIILLRAMQNIMGDQEDGALPYTKPVPLKTFLKELTGEEVEDLNLGAISEVNKKRLFSQGQIFWNHFTNVKYTPSSQELLKLMARGSAVQCKPLQRAFDQLFTVYLNDGSSGVMDCQKATFCGIQTKARKVDSQMRYAADKLTPEIAKMELNGENPYLVLYMSLDSSVGQGAPLLIKRRATDVRQASYGFRGIASFPFIRNDPSLLEALQELICADVDPLKMTEEDGKYFVLKTSPCVYKSN